MSGDMTALGTGELRDDHPWCEGGPPRTLLDGVRSVMQPGEMRGFYG